MMLRLCKKSYVLFHVSWSAGGEQLYLTTCWKPCWPNPTSLAVLRPFLEKRGHVFLKYCAS